MQQLGLLDAVLTPVVTFASKMKGLREEQDMSLRQLAVIAGIDHSTLLRIETGEQAPSPESEARLLRALEGDHDEARMLVRVRRGWVNKKPWGSDFFARHIVRKFPGGLTVDQVAELLQVDPTTVDQDLANAYAKLRVQSLQEGKIGAETRRWIELVKARAEAREEREGREPAARRKDA